MARRCPVEEDDISLFPFLSIIAAVIGVLTLMIAAVTLGQMNQEDVKAAIENAIKMEGLRKELAAAENAVKEMQLKLDEKRAKLLENASSRQTELVKTRAELETLLEQLAAAQQKTEQQKRIEIVIPEVPESQRETLADVQRQLAAVRERLAMLTKELEQRNEPPEEAQVSVLPGGTGLSFQPRFVECMADAIVLHTEDPPLTIRSAQIASHEKFIELLEQVANSRNQTIIFLLRDDSLSTYRIAKKLCDDNNVRNGKLPVVGSGRLDFSIFK